MRPRKRHGRNNHLPCLIPSLLLCLLAGCTDDRRESGAHVLMDFTRETSFYSAPFPSDDLRLPDGKLVLDGFPNPNRVDLIAQGLDLLRRDARGFAVSGGVFFQLTGALDPDRLPSLAQSIEKGAPIFLTEVDEEPMRLAPVEISFQTDGGPFGSPNLLSLLPLQGRPLTPGALYAAVVLRRLGDATGKRLGVSPEMAQIAAGTRPRGMAEEPYSNYRRALATLDRAGIAAREIAGLAVFTTDRPTASFSTFTKDALSRPAPRPTLPLNPREIFDDYCVYHSTISMPDYQAGKPPYESQGGGWTVDPAGNPILQKVQEANLVVTVPRASQPPSGFPTVVFIRTGAGGDRALVDRGPHAVAGGEAIAPGTGPALHFARAGFAGLSVDGPHGGRRNVTGGDEQFLMFNVFNAAALRDNVRQSALEIVLLAHVLEDFRLDAGSCPGLADSQVKFDVGRLALMGHSMGATIAPLAVAVEPRYRAVILSGAGGSWIENVLYKKKPLEVRPMAELILGYAYERRSLTAHDPVLSLVQWAAEAADPQVYADRIVHNPTPGEPPRHVLMLQGIVDHYILPRIANALSLALGLDLAGEARDLGVPELLEQTPLGTVLSFAGRSQISLPASGNVNAAGESTTAVVVQHLEDGVEDGHEVVYQTEPPQHQLRCFLDSFARGVPRVPAGAAATAPCEP